jgi:hypothetical protein
MFDQQTSTGIRYAELPSSKEKARSFGFPVSFFDILLSAENNKEVSIVAAVGVEARNYGIHAVKRD